MRKIVVDNREYEYKIGKTYMKIMWVDPWTDIRLYKIISLEEIKNLNIPAANRDSDIVNRGRWKKTTDGMIFPSEIEKYIRQNVADLV